MVTEISESYLPVIFWYNPDKACGVLADLDGNTWRFKSATKNKLGEYQSVFQNDWEPATSLHPEKHYITTEPSIVLFQVKHFNCWDGRQGTEIVSIEPATQFEQADAEILFIIREKFDMQKSAKRRLRRERYNDAQDLSFRVRRYQSR